MPLFFFHQLTTSGVILDEEGTELPNLSMAKIEALRDALHLMSDAVRQGRDISSRRIQICNEHGHVLSTFSMKDAITSDE